MADKPLINAGELNIQISIQAEYGPADTYGQPGGSWADIATVYASMIQEGSREFYAAQKVNAEVTAVFKIWYIRGIHSRMRIKYGSRYFNILSEPDNPGQRNICLLMATKEVV